MMEMLDMPSKTHSGIEEFWAENHDRRVQKEMTIDVEREMDEICDIDSDHRQSPWDGMNKLLARILKTGSIRDFNALFEHVKSTLNGEHDNSVRLGDEIVPLRDVVFSSCLFLLGNMNDENYEAMLDAPWMSQFDHRHLLWIYENLIMRRSLGGNTCLSKILSDKRIDAGKRAMLCHAIFDFPAFGQNTGTSCFWWYGRGAFTKLDAFKQNREYEAVRRISLSPNVCFNCSPEIRNGIADDRCSVFELHRQLEGRRISDAMLQTLIRDNALQCFMYLLSHYPKQVFRLRTPEEWLFTMCRCVREDFGIEVVNEIERQFPGVVAKARDPWGNTLLWNTFVNCSSRVFSRAWYDVPSLNLNTRKFFSVVTQSPTERLREELIHLGCDPNEENEWGLSYQLLKDNNPEKLLKQED